MLLKSNIPITYILGKIKGGLIAVTIYSVFIAILYDTFHVTRITIPLSVPMVLGTVISLLLGFRSNQAYDRWWEARIIWVYYCLQLLFFYTVPVHSCPAALYLVLLGQNHSAVSFPNRYCRLVPGLLHSLLQKGFV